MVLIKIKYFAYISFFIACIMLCITIYSYMNSSLLVESVEMYSVSANDSKELFDSDKKALSEKTLTGRIFMDSINENQEYEYIQYRIKLKNNMFVSANAIEAQAVPKTGDVFQKEFNIIGTIKKSSTQMLDVTVLSAKSSIKTREFIITYYVWGLPFSLKYIYHN